MKPRSVIVGLTLAFAMVATSLSAQERRPLDHPDYDVWNRIEGERLAPDGDWVVYALAPGDGDKTLVLRETRSSGEWRRPRGGRVHSRAGGGGRRRGQGGGKQG